MRRITTCLIGALLAPAVAGANNRHFTYAYESAVLPRDAHEFELWTTVRNGRDARFSEFDNRLELELGLTDHLQTAFYLNTSATVAGEDAERTEQAGFDSVSSEWKYKLSDARADALGSALYGEIGYGPAELELELKLILDKRAGDALWAANFIVEQEWEDFGGESEPEQKFEVDLGFAYFVDAAIALGLEVRGQGVNAEDEFEGIAVYGGPTLGWAGREAWATVSVLPQIAAFAGEHHGFERDLVHNEKINARLLLGLPF